jgi:hypothetical protein
MLLEEELKEIEAQQTIQDDEIEVREGACSDENSGRHHHQWEKRQVLKQEEELEDEDLDTDLIGLLAINDVPSIAHILLSICETKDKTVKLLEALIHEIDPTYFSSTDTADAAPDTDAATSQGEKKKRPLTYDEEDLNEDFIELNQHNKIARPEIQNSQTIEVRRASDQIHSQGPDSSQAGGDRGENSSPDSFVDVLRDVYDDDSMNETQTITLDILIPNDMGLSAYIIGRHGTHVAEIRRRTKSRTQLELPSLIPPGMTERNIFFMGTVRAVCEAYQHVYSRIVTKADTLPSGCLDDLRMVIPTELSALVIGKGGVSIKKIQAESGARTHLQSEEEMIQRGHSYGRVMLISGTLKQRCHAMYLILKNVSSSLSLLLHLHSPNLLSYLDIPDLCLYLSVVLSERFPRGLERGAASLNESECPWCATLGPALTADLSITALPSPFHHDSDWPTSSPWTPFPSWRSSTPFPSPSLPPSSTIQLQLHP